MVERLENIKNWAIKPDGQSLIDIMEITGHVVTQESYSTYSSEGRIFPNARKEQPASILLRTVDLNTDPSDKRHPVTGVWLCLSNQGLGITLPDVIQKFGKWDYTRPKYVSDEDSLKRFGYRTLIGYVYRRKKAWLVFEFDDDGREQLRIVHVIPYGN